MSYVNGPRVVTDGLVLYLDAGNLKSYIGSGSTWLDLTENADTFASSYYTYPSTAISGNNRYFSFVNNGTTVNNIYNASPKLTTYTQRQYTRMAWFNLQTGNSAWSPIIQNSIGNNSDMGLTINGGYIHFRQYTNTATSGTTSGDYGVNSVGTINTNTWNSAAIVVNLFAPTVTFYINGKFDSTTSINTIGNSSSNTIIIGGASTDSYSGDRMFKGYISAAMHYNRLLTSTEILQNHNALKGRFSL
jgi:hypothetical protein